MMARESLAQIAAREPVAHLLDGLQRSDLDADMRGFQNETSDLVRGSGGYEKGDRRPVAVAVEMDTVDSQPRHEGQGLVRRPVQKVHPGPFG